MTVAEARRALRMAIQRNGLTYGDELVDLERAVRAEAVAPAIAELEQVSTMPGLHVHAALDLLRKAGAP